MNRNDDAPIAHFIDLSAHASCRGFSHRVRFSKMLYRHCRKSSTSKREIAHSIITALVEEQFDASTPFPKVLFRHPCQPCVFGALSENGQLCLELTMLNESPLAVDLVIGVCKEVCRFHEYCPSSWTHRKRSIHILFSRRLKARLKRIEKTCPTIQWLFFDKALTEFLNHGIRCYSLGGVSVCECSKLDDDGVRRVYLMLASESPAMESSLSIKVKSTMS